MYSRVIYILLTLIIMGGAMVIWIMESISTSIRMGRVFRNHFMSLITPMVRVVWCMTKVSITV